MSGRFFTYLYSHRLRCTERAAKLSVRSGKYGMTDNGTTMRIIYDRGNWKLWMRQ